ncbi:hypothetical protein BHM03_00011019 [Ensete ventricosum]|nr:hypothetical protein BHM03_00011019 [Ensete ventricosum]
MRWCCAPLVTTLPTGGPLCGKRRCPSGDNSCGRCARNRLPYGLAPSPKEAPPWAPILWVLPMPIGATLQAPAMPTGRPCIRPWP